MRKTGAAVAREVVREVGKKEVGMRVVMIQERFVKSVLDGVKTGTIRKTARCEAGDLVSIRRWVGKPYRSQQELVANMEVLEVLPVRIMRLAAAVRKPFQLIHPDDLAEMEGFKSWPEMVGWFDETHGLPFDGFWIRWGGIKIS